MSIYSRNLSGLNQRVIVGTNANFTALTTYALFIAGAAEGEVGVFLSSGARKATALAAGDVFFIAQKRDGNVSKTPLINFSDIYRKARTAYVAPVAEVINLGYIGSGSLTLLYDFTAASATNTLTVGLVARDLTPGNQPFPVQEGYATVNSTSANQYDVTSAIIKNFNAELDYEKVQPDGFCYAEILTDAATTAAVGLGSATSISVVNGSAAVAANGTVTDASFVVGAYIAISGAMYKVAAISGNNFTLDRKYQGATNSALAIAGLVTLAYTSGTSKLGIRLTGSSTDFSFTANMFGPSVSATVVTVSTPWVLGSGSGASVRQLESVEGIIFDGVGSTRNAPFREDYGTPSLFSATASTYDLIFLDAAPSIKPGAALPHYVSTQIERVLIATVVGSGLGSTLQTVFGV